MEWSRAEQCSAEQWYHRCREREYVDMINKIKQSGIQSVKDNGRVEGIKSR